MTNMETKAFEIRDTTTFIPVIAILMSAGDRTTFESQERYESERYLMRRAGYNLTAPPFCVILCRLEASGCDRNATYEPYSWGIARTLPTAHNHIIQNWDTLQSGAVIDVEFILHESAEPKKTERETTNY